MLRSLNRLLSANKMDKFVTRKRTRKPQTKETPAAKKPKAPQEEVKELPVPFTYSDWETQLDESWRSALDSFLSSNKLKEIYSWVSREYSEVPCRPPAEEVFTAFKLTPFDQVKVVVVGQDPYPGPTEAMGLSFSVHDGVKVPGSLRNIYKCLETDPKVTFKTPKHGNLSKWARQGVFMLNACLTVRQSKPNSHANKGWESFTDEVIRVINSQRSGVVFMLWGSYAQKKAKGVNRSKHLVLEACHPSPLSASKGGFYTCGHFSAANEYLREKGIQEIDWNLN